MTESLKEAREQHEAAKAEALTLLEEIKSHIEGSSPEKLNWGHTGSMWMLATELTELRETVKRHS